MHKKYNKFLIVSFIGVLILGVYSYFYNDLKSEAASDNSLTSSLAPSATTATVSGSDQAALDTAFITSLFSLKTIKVDTTLLEEQSFKLLIDNNIKLEPVPYGRTNPFAPTDKNSITKVVSILKTNPASGISNQSAVLNGSIEGANSNNIYFEYGTDQNLGKVTPKVKASLVGNFAWRLTALNPKTTYFFRTVASINGVMTFGEIISFNTN